MPDIYLYPEAPSPTDIILRPGAGATYLFGSADGSSSGWAILTVALGKRTRALFVGVPDGVPPIARSLYDSLVDRYGEDEGGVIWARMLAERKGPFQDGAKYDPAKPEVAIELVEAGLHPDERVPIKPLLPYDESADQQTE